jgi:hypothetical protein
MFSNLGLVQMPGDGSKVPLARFERRILGCAPLNGQVSQKGRMIMNTKTPCVVAATLMTALALTSLDIVPAKAAGPSPAAQGNTGTVEMSAHRHWRRGNAAVLGAVAGLFGTIAVLAANDRYRDDYYYGSPYYRPYGYGGPYYAPYRSRYWHHHHWR